MKKTTNLISRSIKTWLPLLIIITIATIFRLTGHNWDQGHYLHPDERFLGMVTNDIKLPGSWQQYLDPEQSSLNPRNHNYNFYVYGNWPLTLNKYVSHWRQLKGLSKIILQGRQLSVIAEILVVLLVFKTVKLIEHGVQDPEIKLINKRTKYWAALIYALLVLPIQQAHFFTTDTFLNLFVFASFYFALHYFFKAKLSSLLMAGVTFGLAIAAKISAIYILPLLIWLLVFNQKIRKKLFNSWQRQQIWISLKKIFKRIISHKTLLLKLLLSLILFITAAYFTVRISSPYLFATDNFFNWQLALGFLDNIEQLKSWQGAKVWYPPAIQWINRMPVWFALKNLSIVGVGLPIFILSLIGVILLIQQNIKAFIKNSCQQVLILTGVIGWVAAFFVYQSSQFVKSIRYFLILYPFIAMAASISISWLLTKLHTISKTAFTLGKVIIMIAIFIWPLMFLNIYLQPHTRIRASHWIYQHIPSNSKLATEHWDDGLPLRMPLYQKKYRSQQLPVFGQDTIRKWQTMEQILDSSDYYILSSNRSWGSIMRLQDKYPRMSQFYQELLAGKTDFKQVAQFSTYPSLEYLGIPLTVEDGWAEEAFSVYDHPEVMIYRKRDYY